MKGIYLNKTINNKTHQPLDISSVCISYICDSFGSRWYNCRIRKYSHRWEIQVLSCPRIFCNVGKMPYIWNSKLRHNGSTHENFNIWIRCEYKSRPFGLVPEFWHPSARQHNGNFVLDHWCPVFPVIKDLINRLRLHQFFRNKDYWGEQVPENLCKRSPLITASKSRKLIMMSLILPKNEKNTLKIHSILSVFCWFFGRIRDFMICFRDLLTFRIFNE